MGIGRLDGVNLMRVGQASKRKWKDCSIGDLRLGSSFSVSGRIFSMLPFNLGKSFWVISHNAAKSTPK